MGAFCSSTAHEQQQQAPVTRRTAGQQQQQQRRATDGEGEEQRNPRASFGASMLGWDKNFPAMTRAALAAKREEFWDTRVSGRAEVWQTLRVACEAGDEETTGAILDSAELTQLDTEAPGSCFVYDKRLGYKYEMPLYCLYTPANLISDATPIAASAAHGKAGGPLQVQVAPLSARHQSGQVSAAAADAKSPEAAAPASASAVAPALPGSGKSVKFKIRFSNGLADLSVEQRSSCSIAQLQSLIQARHPALTPERLRIYYLGKWMADPTWNLGEIGMRKEMVLQCFVLAPKQTE